MRDLSKDLSSDVKETIYTAVLEILNDPEEMIPDVCILNAVLDTLAEEGYTLAGPGEVVVSQDYVDEAISCFAMDVYQERLWARTRAEERARAAISKAADSIIEILDKENLVIMEKKMRDGLPIERLRELVAFVPDGRTVRGNDVGNLMILDHGEYAGFLDLHQGDVVLLDEESGEFKVVSE